jgi:hypothetical protein
MIPTKASNWEYIYLDTNTNLYVPHYYNITDRVMFEDNEYIAQVSHYATSSFTQDYLNGYWKRWNLIKTREWLPGTIYASGDKIKYGHITYICKYGHLSQDLFSKDLSVNLDNLNFDFLYKRNDYNKVSKSFPWAGIKVYTKDELVIDRDITYKCLQDHTVNTLADIYSTRPLYGVNWKSYWTFTIEEPKDLNTRWAQGRIFNINDLVENNGKLYLCKSAYNGLSPEYIDNNEPGMGSTWKDFWDEFVLWDVELTRCDYVNWMSDVPFLRDYLEVIDLLQITNIDHPIVKLTKLRSLDTETEQEILKLTTSFLGFSFLAESSLIDPSSYYQYINYLSMYKSESGTESYLKFLNFIVRHDLDIPSNDTPLSQYIDKTTKVPLWKIKELYTHNYKSFWTKEEVICKLGLSKKYFKTTFFRSNGQTVYNMFETVEYMGWVWSSLVDNNEDLPTLTSPYWTRVSALPESEFVDSSLLSNFDDSEVLYLNFPMTFRGTWFKLESYYLNDTVIYNGKIWNCIKAGAKGYIPYDGSSYWSKVSDINLFEVYNSYKTYYVDDKVMYNNEIWQCTKARIKGQEPSDSSSSWNKLSDSSSVASSEFKNYGYYRTNRVYLYRSDDMRKMGSDLEKYPEYAGITKIFYELSIAAKVIYIKEIGYDYVLSNLPRLVQINPDNSEFEEAHYIPFICNKKITYPTPVRVGNWVPDDLRSCVTCPQKLFTPNITESQQL